VTQIIAGFQCRLGFRTLVVLLFGQPAFTAARPRAFAAQVIDGDVAGAAQKIGAEFFDLHQRPPPETQKQILHQVCRCRAATDTPVHQRFHLRTLGQEHLKKMRTRPARLIVAGFRWQTDQHVSTAPMRRPDWPAG